MRYKAIKNKFFIIWLPFVISGITFIFAPSEEAAEKTIKIPILGPMKFYFGEYQRRAGTLDVEKVIPELDKTDLLYSGDRLKFYPNDHASPHQAIYGENFRTHVRFQWRGGKQHVYYPAAAPVHPVIAAKNPGSTYLK